MPSDIVAWIVFAVSIIFWMLLLVGDIASPFYFKKDPHWKITAVVFFFSVIFLAGYSAFNAAFFQLFQSINTNNVVVGTTKWLSIGIILFVLALLYWGLRFFVNAVISLLSKLGQQSTSLPEEITLMLMGPEGVGKTSVLAVTYHITQNKEIADGFSIIPGQDTMITLQDAYTKLHDVINKPSYQDLTSIFQLEGTRVMGERKFDFYFHQKELLKLRFWDIPGGYMKIPENHPEYKLFQKVLLSAHVFINVLDTVALMEGDEAYFQERATPMIAQTFLQRFQKENPGKPCLILFVLTKAEKWLRTGEGVKELTDTFNKRYSVVIKLLSNQNSMMTGVLIPIKTLGCVEFVRCAKGGDGVKRPVFERKPNILCEPEHVEQILYHILSFSLSSLKLNKDKDLAFQRALLDLKSKRDNHLSVYGRALHTGR